MIPEILFDALARSYEPPHYAIPELLRDGTESVREAIQIAQESVTAEDLASIDQDSRVQSELLFAGDMEVCARLLVISREATRLIQARRLALAVQGPAAPPYGHASLQGLSPDDEGLVSLAAFDIEGDALHRNGFVFFVLPGIPGANANYWLLSELQRAGLANSVRVRLDPLLYGSDKELHGGFYRAAVYSRELDWERIRQLREAEHGQWVPGLLSRGYLFTDYVWIPHDCEVDFQCEELPTKDEAAMRGTRYLHAIYNKRSHQIMHLDGATRILTPQELEVRANSHVRKAGKMGIRMKIFRTDRAIAPRVLGGIAESFFFWNHDVARYFGAPIHPDL